MTDKNKPTLLFELYAAELAVRMIENLSHKKRPEGMTVEEVLEDVKRQIPKNFEDIRICVLTAMEYFQEQIEKHNIVQ